MKRITVLFRAAILAALFFVPVRAGAQGNDFPPFVPNFPPQWFYPVPPYNQGYNYNWGTVWGPYTLWEAKKGDTVEFEVHMNWWPGPIYLSPISDGASNMRYVGGGAWDHGQLGYWCTHCTFRFEAGQDYPSLQLDFYGPYRWGETSGGYIQVTQVIPAPRPSFKILPDFSKQAYHRIGNNLIVFGAGMAFLAQYPCTAGEIRTCIALGSTGIISGLAGSLLTQVDPWDDWYAYPYEPVFPSAVELGLSYLGGGYGDPFWNTVALDNDIIVSYGINVYAYLDAANVSINRANSCHQIGADDCAQGQAERARQFFEAANQNAYWVAVAMGQLAYEYNRQGYNGSIWDDGTNDFNEFSKNSVRGASR